MAEIENDNYAYPGKRFSQAGQSIGEGQGMSLRDHFAGQVLSGMYSGSMPQKMDSDYMRQYGAQYIYEIADAMIDARATT